MDSSLATIRDDLEAALERGWQTFHDSDMPAVLTAFTQEILGGDAYFTTPFRRTVPHPGHERMARLVGRFVPEVMIRHAIQFDELWPGDFQTSSEAGVGDYQVRTFFFTVYRGSKTLGRLAVSFPHKHSEFDVPQAPTVAIVATAGSPA